MGDNGQNGSSNERLDRIEKAMDLLVNDHLAFRDEHKALLRAQVLLTDVTQKLATNQQALETNLQRLETNLQRLEATVQDLAEAQRRTDEKLNILISTVDDLIRRTPPLPPNFPTQ